MKKPQRALEWPRIWGIVLTFAAVGVVAALAPAERTLGANLRVVLLHGAWVTSGKILFGLASLAGLAALGVRIAHEKHRRWLDLANWSQALGQTGLGYWIVYLLMSLYLMQVSWGGFFFDEPRWRIPFTFAVVGLMLQAGLALLNRPALTAAANLAFGAWLWASLGAAVNILHPDAPVAQSDAVRIQVFFALLLGISLLAGLQIAFGLYKSIIIRRL